jgi:phage terminase small subunit
VSLEGRKWRACKNLAFFLGVFGVSEPKKRVDPTAAERKKRWRERQAEKARFGNVPTLSAAAILAEKEARAVLGADFDRFGVAVRRYVNAVDAVEHARSIWEAEGRPMRDQFANQMAGISPYLKAMEQLEAQANRFAGELGLTPASAKRISGLRGAGRPAGAASSADRKAAPPLKLREVS